MGRRGEPEPDHPAPPEPWRSFLEALDSRLTGIVNLHCIGGFAVSVHYGISRETSDIDVLPTMPPDRLSEMLRIAGEGSALHKRHRVYVQSVGVASAPMDYESRLIRLWPRFALDHVSLFALEAHDLALTKLERNLDVDRDDVQALAAAGHLNPGTLRKRYETELRSSLFSPPERNDLTLRLWIDMCWPEAGESG